MKQLKFIFVFLMCANILIYMMYTFMMTAAPGYAGESVGEVVWGIICLASLLFIIGYIIYDSMKGYSNQ